MSKSPNAGARIGFQQHMYSPDDRQVILDMWVRTSKSSAQIAAEVGLRRNQVMGLCDRFMKRKHFPGRAYLQGQFQNHKVALNWWDDCPLFDHGTIPVERNRASAAQLADNRGTLLKKRVVRQKTTPTGQGMRMQRPTIVKNPLSQKEQEARRAMVMDRAAEQLKTYQKEQELAEKIRENHDVLSDPVPDEPLSIMGLRYGMCRAVLGEHPRLPGGMYCGSKISGGAYCKTHRQLFYHRREPSQKNFSRMGSRTLSLEDA